MMRTLLLLVLILPVVAVAEPSGQAGRTSTTTAGCGDCHGVSPKTATTVTLEGGARIVEPGSTTTFTIIVAHPSFPSAGVGIAVRTTETGTVAAGTLAVQAGSGLRVRSGEITQTSARSMTGGSIRFTFTWKAPSQEGSFYIQAIGNAVNGNGNDDANDAWNWMQPVEITVQNTSSVAEDMTHINSIYPNPCRPNQMLTLGVEGIGPMDVAFSDVSGNIVHRVTSESNGKGLPIDVPSLPPGVYAVVVTDGPRTRRTSLLITN